MPYKAYRGLKPEDIGHGIDELCPICPELKTKKKSFLLENGRGNRWCSNVNCGYHVRGGSSETYKTVIH